MPDAQDDDADVYLDKIRRSGLVDNDQLERMIVQMVSSGSGRLSATEIARRLEDAHLVTPWQNGHLAKGRHRGFFLGHYKLLDNLGAGGGGNVYLAEHIHMGRRVAIKLVFDDNVSPNDLQRFAKESAAVAALNHPNIVRAYDFNRQGKFTFLVMEYIDGPSLETLVERQGPLAFGQAADYIRQAAAGLSHVHAAGIVHRDVKPANLLRDEQGVIKLLDLGLAWRQADEESAAHAPSRELLGTIDYIAPEQVVDSHAVDARTDLYSLGGTLYFLLTGHAPFQHLALHDRLRAHRQAEPPSLRDARPDAPAALVDITARLLAKRPDDRFPTAQALISALRK